MGLLRLWCLVQEYGVPLQTLQETKHITWLIIGEIWVNCKGSLDWSICHDFFHNTWFIVFNTVWTHTKSLITSVRNIVTWKIESKISTQHIWFLFIWHTLKTNVPLYRNQLVCKTNQVTGSYLCGSMLLNGLLYFPSPNMIKNLRPKCFHITLQSLSKCRDNHLQGVCQHICLCSFYLLYYSLIKGKTEALS